MLLPNLYNIQAPSNSQFSVVFTIQNDDGTLADITGKIFEFVVRDRLNANSSKVLVSVNSSTATSNGYITVTTAASTVEVVLTAVGVGLITDGGGPYTLWMDQGLSDATAMVTGTFFVQQVAAP